MKTGDVINGYRILQDFTTAGGGLCKWTFAAKGGKQFFIKEFLSPTFPIEGSPGSAKTKADKRSRCEQFEKHHKGLRDAVASSCSHGGNLVFTLDFFRFGTKYYKITEKVDVAGLRVKSIATLPLDRKILILKTVAHSLHILHHLQIVHGDIKPDNILIKQTADGFYAAKLIDFDNSFFSRKPPVSVDEVVGDMAYYSPELARYILRDKGILPVELTEASDIFALGLIYCQYLTGKLPTFNLAKYQYAYGAVIDGVKLSLAPAGLPVKLIDLIGRMLDLNVANRPSVSHVFSELKKVERVPDKERPTVGLKGSLMTKMVKPAPEAIKPVPGSSSLRGSLIRKR